MSEPWAQYDQEKPSAAGVYQWRVPSAAVKGLVVTFYGHMRLRGAGHTNALSPAFDYWNGQQVIVPPGTEWREVPNSPKIKPYEYAEIFPESATPLPCPFCGEVPTWKALEGNMSGGFVLGSGPHHYNRWWLECCGWAQTPRFTDPRVLVAHRNALIANRSA